MLPLWIMLAANPVWTWLRHLGGLGLILLGLADNSLVPIPGSMDAAVVLLSAHRQAWWPYYALMATIGAVVGGYLTYRLAEKGGKEVLEKKVGKQRTEKVYKRFEERGFLAVFAGAILPPPFPIVPVLMTAGILHYPHRRFLPALALGRGIRFFGLAYVGHIYGVAIIEWLARYYKPLLYTFISLGVAGGFVALWYFLRYRQRTRNSSREEDHVPAKSADR
jgi:membrane protein YqaA with SNARE-associated domain